MQGKILPRLCFYDDEVGSLFRMLTSLFISLFTPRSTCCSPRIQFIIFLALLFYLAVTVIPNGDHPLLSCFLARNLYLFLAIQAVSLFVSVVSVE